MNFTKLDKVFSEYIRRKNADEYGRVKCCTCNTWLHWKEIDNGHFIPRQHLITRWNEFNCSPQCELCNRYRDGNITKYELFLKEKYGEGFPDTLRQLSRQAIKITQVEIDELTEFYKQKIKELS